MARDDFSTGLPGEVEEPRPDLLEELISDMYDFEGDFADVEFMSHTDLVESVRGVITKANSVAVYDVMIKLNFQSKVIEGTVYWLVYSV